jgi:hypothetical protein
LHALGGTLVPRRAHYCATLAFRRHVIRYAVSVSKQ